MRHHVKTGSHTVPSHVSFFLIHCHNYFLFISLNSIRDKSDSSQMVWMFRRNAKDDFHTIAFGILSPIQMMSMTRFSFYLFHLKWNGNELKVWTKNGYLPIVSNGNECAAFKIKTNSKSNYQLCGTTKDYCSIDCTKWQKRQLALSRWLGICNEFRTGGGESHAAYMESELIGKKRNGEQTDERVREKNN